MGPEVAIIAVSYNIAVLLAVGLVIGLAFRGTRRWATLVLVVSAASATSGYFSAPPHWERHLAYYHFAETGVLACVVAATFVLVAHMFAGTKKLAGFVFVVALGFAVLGFISAPWRWEVYWAVFYFAAVGFISSAGAAVWRRIGHRHAV